MLKLIEKIGFFRLTLIPIGVIITITAFKNGIHGMGVVGIVVILFGVLNKCLLFGTCDLDANKKTKKILFMKRKIKQS
ncbi:MAG: hypothetical protein MUF75_09590 [Bacteroidia bacterium]|jgi:hypothetical protein|nr:hypothetical protein [Bacteroidia bacterium]